MNGVRVRAVKGRTLDPFRGSVDDGSDVLTSRPADVQPMSAVIDALRKMEGVTIERNGTRTSVTRARESLDLELAAVVRSVSVEDITFTGDTTLLVSALYALLPLYGPVEIQIGRYTDLIDGHEPAATVAARFDAWWIEDSLKLAKKLEARDKQEQQAEAHRQVVRRKRIRIAYAATGIGLVAVILGAVWWAARGQRIGQTCRAPADCASEQCLPREPVTAFEIDGHDLTGLLPPPRTPDGEGACTASCTTDTDCPGAMYCGDVYSYDQFQVGHGAPISLGGHRVTMCIPRAWKE
jgi:hypothetical protein